MLMRLLRSHLRPYRRPLLGTGLCGAFTTFSTMQLELLRMIDAGRGGMAAGYAAASVAAPPATASFTNARLSKPCNVASWRLGVCVSVMARKAAPVPPGDHGPQRRGVDDEHEHHVGDGERHEEPHGPEVPVTGRLKPAE